MKIKMVVEEVRSKPGLIELVLYPVKGDEIQEVRVWVDNSAANNEKYRSGLKCTLDIDV